MLIWRDFEASRDRLRDVFGGFQRDVHNLLPNHRLEDSNTEHGVSVAFDRKHMPNHPCFDAWYN